MLATDAQMAAIVTGQTTGIVPLLMAMLMLLGSWLVHSLWSNWRAKRVQREVFAALDNLSEGIYRWNADGRLVYSNAAFARFLGPAVVADGRGFASGSDPLWYVEAGRHKAFSDLLNAEGKVEDFVSQVRIGCSGRKVWVSENARAVRDVHGRLEHFEGTIREITDTVARAAQEARLKKIADHVPGGLFQLQCDKARQFSTNYFSDGLKHLYGLPGDLDLENLDVYLSKIHPDDIPIYQRSLRQSMETGAQWYCEIRLVLAPGETRWVSISATVERSDEGMQWHGFCQDITDRKAYEAKIEELAYLDPVTQLPNRRMIIHTLQKSIASCARRGDIGALLYLDIDDFRGLNGFLGGETADELLSLVGERIASSLRRNDTVGRLDGDRFAIIIDDVGQVRETACSKAAAVAAKVRTTLEKGFLLDGSLRKITASIGICLFDGGEQSAATLIEHAEIAKSVAKQNGRDTYRLFDPVTMDTGSDHYLLLQELRDAIEGQLIELHYQPQVDNAGNITSAEALARWVHPRFGMVYPDQFIPIAEKFGLINALGKMVLHKGLTTLAHWQADPDLSELGLSINICPTSIMEDGFVEMIAEAIDQHQVDPRKLTLEITESVLAHNKKEVAARMQALRDRGIKFSLDDFGTGYASLSYIKRMPFDEVKIDGSFVTELTENSSDQEIVRTILAMSGNMRLRSVAEHVESRSQVEFLSRHGCDCFQGYLFGKPMLAHELEDLVLGPAAQAKVA
jgi:diguanylate cyclase (GGDEF)-like protein